MTVSNRVGQGRDKDSKSFAGYPYGWCCHLRDGIHRKQGRIRKKHYRLHLDTVSLKYQ